MKRLCLALVLTAAYVLSASAQCSDVDYAKVKACVFTGVNGRCTVMIDRLRAATPPTIYVRRRKKVIVKVINLSPLEKLELDQTSINTQIPIDSVQALAPLLTTLGQFALAMPEATPATPAEQQVAEFADKFSLPVEAAPPPPTFDSIDQEQKDLSSYIDGATRLKAGTSDNPGPLLELAEGLGILRGLLLPPLDGCNSASDWRVNISHFDRMLADFESAQDAIHTLVGDPGTGTGGAGIRLDIAQKKLVDIQAHIDIFKNSKAAAQKASDDQISELKTSISNLNKQLAAEQKKLHPVLKTIQDLTNQIQEQTNHMNDLKESAAESAPVTARQIEGLTAAQSALSDKLTKAQTLVKTVLFPAETKLQALIAKVKMKPVSPSLFKIKDLLFKDKNDQQEVFTLNAVNYLTDPVKIFVAPAATDPFSQSLADSIVATAPTKTAVSQVTVQYVTQPEMEVTAGVLVPFLPYKSYTAAAQSAGSATLVAQETDTYTIIPTADVNFRLGNDKFAGTKRYGWFGTIAVGYNPATSMVEFGLGPSFALKSMVFSPLADIGRDTELAIGFTKNQPLPGSATTPGTNGVWSVKPSFGFSIRLPFNSGGGH